MPVPVPAGERAEGARRGTARAAPRAVGPGPGHARARGARAVRAGGARSTGRGARPRSDRRGRPARRSGSCRSWTSARRRPRPRGSPGKATLWALHREEIASDLVEFVAADDARRVVDGVVPESVELAVRTRRCAARSRCRCPAVERSRSRAGPTASTCGPTAPASCSTTRPVGRTRRPAEGEDPIDRRHPAPAPGLRGGGASAPRRHRRRGGVLVRVGEGRVRPGSVPARRRDRGAIPRRRRPHRRQHRRGVVPGGAG